MLKAAYDLAMSPPTYDVVAFLIWVEAERIRARDTEVEIAFLPGPVGGFRSDKLWPRSIETRRALFDSIVEPMARMLPARRSIATMNHNTARDLGFIGVGRRCYGLDLYVESMKTAGRPLRPWHGMFTDRNIVTITLRECEHWPERNSNVRQWLAAAGAIERMGYRVVFIRDTAHADTAFAGFAADAKASRHLDHRAALYRNAACNLFVSNGPAWFAMALDAPLLIFKPCNEALGSVYSARYFARCGIAPGGQVPGAGVHQRLVWAEDRAEVIVAAFARFIDAAGRHAA